MALEKKIQNKIIKYLKDLDLKGEPIYWEKRQAGGFTYCIGLPDLYVVYNGTHYEIEIKEPNGERSSSQIKWETIFKQKNIQYACVKNFEEFAIIIEKIRKGEKI